MFADILGLTPPAAAAADAPRRLTHGPPHGTLDTVLSGEHVGCEALARTLPTLRPRLHVFGHIHEAHGAVVKQWDADADTVCVNPAAWPMGPRARGADGMPVPFGTGPFSPVVVDLLEDDVDDQEEDVDGELE